jgi:prepilin-type N-terminal cleavage/methylation domain-containing protein
MIARSTRAARRGMTLIEVLIALVILATVLVGLAEYLGRFARNVNVTAVQATAGDLVTSRLEALKGITSYDRVDAFALTETAIAGFDRYTRITTVSRVSSAQEDYKLVTVRVTHPILGADTVRKTTVVPRF